MSPNPQKRKGSAWERQAVAILNEHIKSSKWFRISGSGAIGTIIDEPILMGDIKGKVDSVPKKFKGEAKVGYSNRKEGEAKSFTMQKEWLDKIREEADLDYSLPFLICKFDNARSGTRAFVSLDLDTFVYLINYITELKDTLDNG